MINKRNIEFINIFLMLIFIYINFSLWFLETSEPIKLILSFILFVLLYRLNNKNNNGKLLFYKNSVLFIVMIILLISISCFSNFIFNRIDIFIILRWIIALFIVNSISEKDFSKYYIKCMYIISIFSLISYFISLLKPSIFLNFSYFSDSSWLGPGDHFGLRNAFVSVVDIGSNYRRNWGIFYEPGMFAFYLNLALYLLLFKSESINKKMLLFLSIALITTFSTSGYITFGLMFIALVLKNKKNSVINYMKNNKKIIFLFIVMIIGVVVFFITNPNNWLFFSSKFSEIGNKSISNGSGYSREKAMYLALEAIKLRPLTGISSSGISQFFDGNISTFTPLQWFATYGLLYGLICNVLLLYYAIDKNEKLLCNIFKYFAIVSMIVSQNMSSNIMIMIIIIYSFNVLSRRKYDIRNSADL